MILFRKIWAFYGVVVFSMMWLLVMPFYLIILFLFPRKGTRWLIWFSHHILTSIVLTLTLVKVKVEGKEKLDLDSSYIIISNHQTAVDFIANAVAFPGIYRFLAKQELVKVPVFGFIIKQFCVLVDRSSVASRAKSIVYLKNVLAQGVSVFIYPEGTRNNGDELLGDFQQGAFRLAIQTGTPIAVHTIVNMNDISAVGGSPDLSPGVLKIVWDDPIETKNLSTEDVPQLIQRVRRQMMNHLREAENQFEVL